MKSFLIAFCLCLLALAVRLPSLDAFFTADEFLWVERSRDFLEGLMNPNFACVLPDQDQLEDAVSAETGLFIERPLGGQGIACTLRTGHPGVLTMWTGAVGISLQWFMNVIQGDYADRGSLLEFIQHLPTSPIDHNTIAPVRLPTVILTAFFVPAFYLLLRRLIKPNVAVLAGLLLALNPFHIALSRILHHDALSTIFIILSALSTIIYFGVERKRAWLYLSAVCAGVAMLSKLTGLFVIPYTGLITFWSMVAVWSRQEATLLQSLKRVLNDGLQWTSIAALTYFVCWPAMWVIPGRALNVVFAIGTKYAEGGHAKGVFFFGTTSKDPGHWFYPVMWLFNTNPWAMLGVVLALGISAWHGLRKISFTNGPPKGGEKSRDSPLWRVRGAISAKLRTWFNTLSPQGFDDKRGLLIWLTCFIFFFLLALTLTAKKQARYALPIYPMLDIIAAIGLLYLVKRQWIQNILFGSVLVVNLTLILWYQPYYFTYFNPLIGGIRTATKTVTVGWGEGLNEAAAYLNTLPDADSLTVSAWYGSTFAPFFKGETVRYSYQKGHALAGDYVIFYINQLQRRYPDMELWHYLVANQRLVQTISVSGVVYAWIFTGPGLPYYVEDQTYKGIASLLAWEWHDSMLSDNGVPQESRFSAASGFSQASHPIRAGTTLDFSLFWEYLGKQPDEPFFFRLIGPDGQIWAMTTTHPSPDFQDTTTWRRGQIIEEHGSLLIPLDTPPGDYGLDIGFYTTAPAVPSGELTFPVPTAPLSMPLQTITVQIVAADEAIVNEAATALDDLRLLGQPNIQMDDQTLALESLWFVPTQTSKDYQIALALADTAGKIKWAWPARPLIEFLPTSNWPTKIPLRSQTQWPLDQRTPGGSHHLHLNLYRAGRACLQAIHPVDTTILTQIDLPGRVRQFDLPEGGQSLKGQFADVINLLAVRLPEGAWPPQADQSLDVSLFWGVLGPIEKDLTVFVQLLAPDGTVIAQQDAQPLDGQAPTSTWTPGEVVNGIFTLTMPDQLAIGDYQLITGFYEWETGQRLATETGDFVVVASGRIRK